MSLGRDGAIKIFHAHAWADPAFRVRFRRECESLIALEHPNVIPVLDAGESDGVGWLVMHLAAGGSLADRLAQGPLDPDQAVGILRQVASALDAAHVVGRLHRDVKPANVLLEPDGHAWLADFGVARPVGSTTTVPGQTVGTAAYMAPEVIAGDRARPPADLYAFACMAFEVLTGRRPFPDTEVATVLFAHLDRPAPPARSLRPDLPAGVERALAAGLAKDPRDRPRSARALVDAIAAHLPGAGGTAPMGVLPSRERASHRRGGRAVAVLAATALLAVGSAGGLAWVATTGGDGSHVAPAETPLPRIPTGSGEVRGIAAPPAAVPGTTGADRIATTTIGDGLRVFSVEAGPGRAPSSVAASIAAALGASGLEVGVVGLEGDGTIALAHHPGDLLRIGDTWAVAEVPGARPGDADRVVVAHGDDGMPARFANLLSATRPAEVIAPG